MEVVVIATLFGVCSCGFGSVCFSLHRFFLILRFHLSIEYFQVYQVWVYLSIYYSTLFEAHNLRKRSHVVMNR